MEFERGETVERIIEDKSQLVLRRRTPPATALKKTSVRKRNLKPAPVRHFFQGFDDTPYRRELGVGQ